MTLRLSCFQAHVSRNSTTTACGIVFLLALSTLAMAATPIVVDANSRPCLATSLHYTTIQAAVSAAPAGATVQVCPGVYAEQVTISTPLTLKAVQKNNQAGAVIAIPASGGVANGGPSSFPVVAQVDITAQNVTLDSLTIDGTGGIPASDCSVPTLMGVVFEAGSSGRVTHSAVRNQAVANGPSGSNGYCGTGIEVFSGAAALVTIDNNSVRGFGETGIAADSPATIKGNFVYQGLTSVNLLQQGTGIFSSAPATITGNTVHHVGFAIAGGLSGTGATTISYNNISADGFGVYLYFGSGISVTHNTISAGLQNPGLTGGNAGVLAGIQGVTVQANLISGFYYGTLAGTGNTVTQNTIEDAEVGVLGITGNTVSSNRFYEVTTPLSN